MASRVRFIPALYLCLVVVFLANLARFYHPGTGFTYLIEFGDSRETELPAVRDVPHYVHEKSGGYDGQWYAQIAVDPLLRNPAIDRALDNPVYRARRILFSWTAFALGLGRPFWILQAYAVQNIIFWIVLAWLLVRWFPPTSLRNFAGWSACLLTHGMTSSIRNALLDGPSAVLIALAVFAMEQTRSAWATGIVGIAGLGRETNLLASVILLEPGRWSRERLLALVLRVTCVAVPLLLWLWYLRSIYRCRVFTGMDYLAAPFTAYVDKWSDTVRALRMMDWAAPAWWSLQALIALTVQFLFLTVYVAVTRDVRNPWCRLGLAYCMLMMVLVSEAWAGHPSAATRVLLPMTLAFNVLVLSNRWFWPLFVLGNLTVLSGARVVGLWPP